MTGSSEAGEPSVPPAEAGAGASVPSPATIRAQLESIVLAVRQQTGESKDGIGPAEARLLQFLAQQGDSTVPELARLRGTSRQNIQIIANRLEREGCVEFNGNPAHKRSVLVRLTERGRERMEQAAAEARELEAKLMSALPGAELKQASELLQRIHEAFAAEAGETKDFKRERALRFLGAKKTAGETRPSSQSATPPGLSDQPTDYGLPSNLL